MSRTFRSTARSRSRCPARSMAGARCMRSSASCRWPTISRRRFRYAQNGFPVTQLIALYWKGNMKAFERGAAMIEETRQCAPHLSDRRACAGRRRSFPQSRSGAHAVADRQGWSRRLLQGRDRAQDRRLFQAHRRRSALRGFRVASRRMGRAARRELSRLRRLRTAAQQPGRGGPADAADPERLRSEEDGRRQRRHVDRDARSQAADL